jgi:site-specific DNA recombinase
MRRVYGLRGVAMTKAFAYLRVSGKGQVEGDGFQRQLETIRAYAKAKNIEIVQVFEERGVSGEIEDKHRPTWVAMAAEMRSQNITVVIVEKLDRLARQQGLQEYILYDMGKRGFTVESAREEDINTKDPTRILFRQIMGAIAQYDKAMIVEKLYVARRRKAAANGRCEGGKPYGFYPGEKYTLDLILLHGKQGFSAKSIAERLNEAQVSPRSGAKWHPFVVAKILRSNLGPLWTLQREKVQGVGA